MDRASLPDFKSGTDSKKSQVLRPFVNRWVNVVRRNKGSINSGEQAEAAVHILPSSPTVADVQRTSESTGAESAERVCELQQQVAELEVAFTEWIVRCESLKCVVDRKQEQRDQAGERLSVTGESVPEGGTSGLSALQSSYWNFAMAFELQQKKHRHAMHKVAALQSRHASLLAEVLALSEDHHSDDQDFRHAA